MTSVSVVMAVYNGERFLREQVQSVLSQLLPGDELIVIEDGSTDGSLALLGAFEQTLLKIYRNPQNLGVIGSFERGLQLAAHELIFLCDQDDVWLPGKRAAVVAAFEQDPAVQVVISDAQVIDADGRMLMASFMTARGGYDGSILATLWRNRYLGCAMALRRTLLPIALPVPSAAPMHDMWFGALARLYGKVVYLPTPLLKYRRHSANVSPAQRQSTAQMIRWRFDLATAIVVRMLAIKFRRRPARCNPTHP
jgi:glycosyltransferase involved in cell wall biosynthesis